MIDLKVINKNPQIHHFNLTLNEINLYGFWPVIVLEVNKTLNKANKS